MKKFGMYLVMAFMVDQKNQKPATVKGLRALQLLFLVMAAWFIYWAHVDEMIWWNKTFVESLQSSIPNVLFYSISIIAIIFLELLLKKVTRVSVHKSSVVIQKGMVKQNQLPKHEKSREKQIPSVTIGISLISIGALLLAYSTISSSVVVAFIGLSLTFWGILFLFIRPTKFVRSDILNSSVISSYETIDKAIDGLNYTGKPMYIPPYPKEAYLPEHLKGLKDLVVFISAKDTVGIPPIEELAKSQFLVKKPEGICIAPPGSGLVSLFEKELQISFTEFDQESLYEGLQRIIVENLELAANFELKPENNLIHAKITRSVYNYLYSKELMLNSVYAVGCPLTSAVACALAKTTGKAVTIVKTNVTLDLKTVEIWYQIMEG
jgi:hypothetical protein